MNAKESAKIERNLCVLFADVSGSTRLYEKLGDKEALHAVERCLNRMTRATEQFKGRVIKTIGDEVMAVFDSAEAGMDAACSMQQRVDDLPPVSGIKLAIRIGFHFGPAIEDAKDVFGDTVNTAARMAGLAKAGQIITTGETVGALPTLLQQSTREIDALSVKGKAEDVRVCEVIWQESDDLTMKSGSVAPAPVAARLTVRHGGEEKVLDPGHGAFSLGRDAASDIMIADRRASRTHARIERRRDKFVLIDQSTNGTYVTFDGEAEFALKREEVILRGLITTQTGINPVLKINEVAVHMGFTLVSAGGKTISNVTAKADSYSGTDTLGMALTLVNEQADEAVAQLYNDYCRLAGKNK